MDTDTAEKLREKVRQRRRVLQQSFASEEIEELVSHETPTQSAKSWVDTSYNKHTIKVTSFNDSPSKEKTKEEKPGKKKEHKKLEKDQEMAENMFETTAEVLQSPQTSKWFANQHQKESDVREIPTSYPNIGQSVKVQTKTVTHQDSDKKSEMRLAMKKKLKEQFHPSIFQDDEENKKDKDKSGTVKFKHQKMKAKWKKSLSLVMQDKQHELVSEEEAYDFFTRMWESEESQSTSVGVEKDQKVDLAPSPVKKSTENEDIVEQNENDTTRLLVEDYFQIETDQYIPVPMKAACINNAEQVARENKIYFYPSTSSVPLQQKITDGLQPRNIEAEGLYVGKKPPISSYNLNVLENRFLKQQGKEWFGDDGKLIMQPDPCRKIPFRPPILPYQEPLLETVYRKAVVVDDDKWSFNRQKDPNMWHQLDVDISNISFTHHSLFSKEHVLVSRLISLIQSYNGYILGENGAYLSQRLQALRSAAEKLKNTIYQESDNEIIKERKERLLHYQEDIKQIRKLKDVRETESKLLMISILALWEEIQDIRNSQKFTNTPVNLVIHKEETDPVADQELWEKEIQEELEEERVAYDNYYEQQLKKYQTKLEKWKKWTKSRKQASRRQKLRDKLAKETIEEEQIDDSKKTELEETELHDQEILSQEEILKPQFPKEFNDQEVLENIQQKASEARRMPGEHKLYPEINFNGSITPHSQCSKSEQMRRNEVAKRKIYFKIFFNNKEVCQTCERSLGQDFTAYWGQIFNLCIVHWPQSVKIEIYEKSGILSTHLADVWLPLPDPSLTSNNSQLSEQEFSSEEVVTYRHAGIGSGVTVHYLKDDQPVWLLSSGVLKCSLAWGISKDGKTLGPVVQQETSAELRALHEFDKLTQIVSTGLANIQELRNWVEQCHLDPNDPSNSAIFQAINYYNLYLDGISQHSVDYFHLEPLQSVFDFATEEELENNARFHLLELRSQEVPEFRNYNMIPAYEKEIPKDILEVMEKLKMPEKEKSKTIESQREKAAKLLKQIREQVLKRFYAAQHQRVLEDVVIEEEVPSIETLGFSLFSIMETQRPLCPTRKERKKMTGQTISNTNVKVIVTVMHALNVPVRVDNNAMKGTARQTGFSNKDSPTERLNSPVRPYVEIMFQRETARTHVNEGPHPTWNEELHLPFKAPGDDYSPTNLETVRDIIYLSLFDEVMIDVLEDERDRDSTVHKKMQRHWLGDLKIPFTTLYLNSKIEGTFQLNVPPVLLGYDYEERPWLVGGKMHELEARHTYLSLFLTIEPCLQLPEVFRQKYESLEPERILQEIEKWNTEFQKEFPNRSIRTMAIDISGKWVLISRYLCPIKPPDQLIDASQSQSETMEMLARFVSLIPTQSDSVIFPGICDIWSTCDQFLQMLMGDEEEHAVLLCNYFLHMKIKAMLLLGSAIPEGLTSYVITWEDNNEVLIWNASSGQHFNVGDSYSPLQHVYCLVSPDNIWANIQKSDIPSQMMFDLNITKDWKSFFHKKFPNPGINNVQPSCLSYSATDTNFVQQLQDSLETMLKDSIMKWRRRFRTFWNRHCIQILRNLLPRLEKSSGRTASLDSLRELEQILISYTMCGFPLSMPYTDNRTVADSVYATGVHLLEGKNIEFALAVYVHPYPCSVLAIWVYVAALIRR